MDQNKFVVVEMLNNFGSIDARNLSSVNTIKQSLEESIRQTEEHGFVNAYLSRSKAVGRRCFTKQSGCKEC
jgi:hypothetical protein